jgi:hypothetical protein
VDFSCVMRCQGFVTAVASGCGPAVSPRSGGGDLGARPVSSSRGLRILGPVRVFVSLSGSIWFRFLYVFKLEHFIIYVSLL